MSIKTLFFVQPYAVKRQKLAPRGALTFFNGSEALKAGAQIARRRAGVVVMSQNYDAERDLMARPVVLTIHGQVPDEWLRVDQGA